MGKVVSKSVIVKQRESNFEFLRILAMFLVLIVHADFWSNGCPNVSELIVKPISSFTRIFIESAAIVCVNIFVMISGWFGIRPSVKSFCNFVFQCLYFGVGIYLIMIFTGYASLTAKGVAQCFVLTSDDWFIRSYIGLYILAPVLNTFIEKSNKVQLGSMLFLFYLFQTVYGWSGTEKFVVNGYSTFSFIGLYLLARYFRIYGIYRNGWIIYVISIVCIITCSYAFILLNCTRIDAYAYCSPFVVAGSAGIIMQCAKLKLNYSKIISFVAKSSFAVFLLHTNPHIGQPVFIPLMRSIYVRFSGLTYLGVTFAVLVAIFALAVLLDQPRKWLWNHLNILFG